MKLIRNIRSISRKTKFVLAIVTAGLIIGVPVATKADWWPSRPTFDYNKYSGNNNCDDPNNTAAQNGRCGSLNGPVLNSFVNTPDYGDERSFTDGRRSDQSVGSNTDPITNVTDGSHQVVIRMQVHNNANQGDNCLPQHRKADGNCSQIDWDAKGIAHNTTVKIELPTNTGDALRAVGIVSASNATPNEVLDSVDMTANQKFSMSYVAGSAHFLRNNISYPLSDNIVTSGALVGDQKMDGNLPGCFNFAGLVEITVNITPQAQPNLQIVKEVKKVGDDSWQKMVTVHPGDHVQWILATKDIGLTQLTNAAVRDVLPPHMQFDPGSVQMYDQNGFHNEPDQPLFGNGLGLGTYESGGGRYVMFTSTALGDFDDATCSVRVRNIGLARSDQTAEASDVADVTITKANCSPPPQQTLTCNSLSGTIGDNRTVVFNANASATGGASIASYQYSFGDGSAPVTTDQTSVSHTYSADGTYNVSLNVNGRLNGSATTVTSTGCATHVTIKTPSTQTLTCNSLTGTIGDNRTVTFAANATASGGAQITSYHYDFGDGTPVFNTDKTTVSHTYAKDGQFAAHLTVQGNVNDKSKTVTSTNCATAVSFITPPSIPTPPKTTPTPPTELVNTGPGSIAALFATVMVAGTMGYRWFLGRRLS